MRKTFILLPLAFCLFGCSGLPSPQDTQPTQNSKCAAIRAKMIQVASNNNTPTAIATTNQIDYQQIYHDECE